MSIQPRLWALIVAGGTGTRFGGQVPKQYVDLAGKPTIRWSIEAFLALEETAGVMVAIGAGQDAPFAQATAGLADVMTTSGGATRQESVHRGLEALAKAGATPEDVVMIHDAARPLIHSRDIHQVYAALLRDPARGYALGFPQSDALKHAGADGLVQGERIRKETWAVQTPQGFALGVILAAHRALATQGLTPGEDSPSDDLAVATRDGVACALIRPAHVNIKLTEQTDTVAIEELLRVRATDSAMSGLARRMKAA